MLLTTSNLSKYYGTDKIFENVSFEIAEHDKVGFIGSNGAGKTTLLKILTGEEAADDGQFFINKNLRIGYMKQHTDYTAYDTVFNEMLKVFEHLIKIEEELADIVLSLETGTQDRDALIERQTYLTEKFSREGGYVYKSKIRSVLLGLGFGEEEFSSSVNVLSGGQRTRLLLARLLLEEPDLLLLDEPTNHLDIASVAWLEDYLSSYTGGLLVISHDRYFLDKITNRTMELENGKLTCYKGNYSKYAVLKEQENLHKTRVFENTTAEIARLKSIIEQQRRWNREKNIKTAESKQKIVDKLTHELEAPPEAVKTIDFSFVQERSSGNDVLSVRDLAKSFESHPVFKNISFDIRRKDRIFLLGANGCGKTTLFKVLLGKLQSDCGDCRFGSNVDIGYYDQTASDLTPENTVIEEVWDDFPSLTHTEVRSALASFLFFGEDVFKTVGELSGGERARVALVKLMLGKYNFLMLDEPTNHLDIASREVLEHAFESYEGTMLIISHDRYFINKLANSVWEMSGGGIVRFDGNYDYYLEKSQNKVAEEKAETQKKEEVSDYQKRKDYAKKVRKLENTIAKLEKTLEETDLKIAELKEQMNAPEVVTDYAEMMKINEEIEALTLQYDEDFAALDEAETELKGLTG